MSEKRVYDCAPVLLIGFNRPDFMGAQIAAVRAARPARLYVAVDGPRPDRPDEAEKCRAVRECVKLVDWPCEVKTLFREENLGCREAVCSAISWLFEHEESGLILEDDVRPSVGFFRFVTEMLERYKDDERIGVVSGFNAYNLQRNQKDTYHFSSHFDCWGWGTWRRVWNGFEPSMTQFEKTYKEVVWSSSLEMRSKQVLYRALERCYSGVLSTWDYPFTLWFMAHKWLSVVPRVRLTGNVGFRDENATNTGGYNYFASKFARLGTIEADFNHPFEIKRDAWADHVCERMDGAIFPRALTWLGAKMGGDWFCKCLTFCGSICERVMPWLFRI